MVLHDVARCIIELAEEQERHEAETALVASKRRMEFSSKFTVVPYPGDNWGVGAGSDDNNEHAQARGSVTAPAVTLYMGPTTDPASSHWFLEYEGMQYDITTFPQGVNFVLRCIADTMLALLGDELDRKGVAELDAHVDLDVRAHAEFGSSLPSAAAGGRWDHWFGHSFVFGNTHRCTYELQVQRYVLSLGKHIIDAAQAVCLLAPKPVLGL